MKSQIWVVLLLLVCTFGLNAQTQAIFRAFAVPDTLIGEAETANWDQDVTDDFNGSALDLTNVPTNWANVVVSDNNGIRLASSPGTLGQGAIHLRSSGSASGSFSLSLGRDAEARGPYSTSLGRNAIVETAASYGMALGLDSRAKGTSSVAIGQQANANGAGSIAAGLQAKTTGGFSVSFARGSDTTSRSEFVIGQFPLMTPGDQNNFIVDDPLFTIGNGTSAGARSNAFQIRKNGKVRLYNLLNSQSNWLSGDGDAEGIKVGSTGFVGVNIAPTAPLHVLASQDIGFKIDYSSGLKYQTRNTISNTATMIQTMRNEYLGVNGNFVGVLTFRRINQTTTGEIDNYTDLLGYTFQSNGYVRASKPKTNLPASSWSFGLNRTAPEYPTFVWHVVPDTVSGVVLKQIPELVLAENSTEKYTNKTSGGKRVFERVYTITVAANNNNSTPAIPALFDFYDTDVRCRQGDDFYKVNSYAQTNSTVENIIRSKANRTDQFLTVTNSTNTSITCTCKLQYIK